MANLMPTDIAPEVRQVLLQALDAGRYGGSFLTAYQILDASRERLAIGSSPSGALAVLVLVPTPLQVSSRIPPSGCRASKSWPSIRVR